VQTVTAATTEATLSMQELSAVSKTADMASRSVLAGADAVGHNAATLRAGLSQFLEAMAHTDEEDHCSGPLAA
jgi:hypothetical protein